MENLIDALRSVIGTADFYIDNGNYSGSWDYGAMTEYLLAGMLLLITVASVFRFLGKLVSR